MDYLKNSSTPTELRKKAEEKARQSAAKSPVDLAALSPAQIQQILHELSVQQIELELQNEELRRTQADLDTSRDRYFNLYELAPVGYCTLAENGLIQEANLTAANLLCLPRSALIKQPISRFICKEDLDLYLLRRKQLFETKQAQSFDLRLVRLKQNGSLFWVHMQTTLEEGEGSPPVILVVLSEIGERKRAEELLKKSSERLQRSEAELKKAQSVAHVGSWVWDIEKNQVEWSDEMYRIFGIDPKTVTGRLGDAISRVIHPDDLHIVQASNALAFTERKPIEYRIIRPDGAIRTIWAETGDVVLDEAGSPLFLTGTAQDITAHKEIENALRKSEERFRATIEQSFDGILVIDGDFRIVEWNSAQANIFGYTRAEMIGMHLWDYQFAILPAEQKSPQYFEQLKARVSQAANSGDSTWMQTLQTIHIQAKDGSRKTVQVSSFPMDAGGEKLIGSITRDISAERAAQQILFETKAILQAAMDNSQAGIAIADAPDGKLRYVNQAGLLIPNKGSEELVNGVDINQYVNSWQILHFDGTPFQADEVPLARAILYGEQCSKEFIIRRENLEDRIVLANAAPIFDEAGQVKAGIVVFLDITERKQAEEALLLSQERLELAQRSAGAGIWDWDMLTGQLNWSPEFFSLFGLDPHKALASFDTWNQALHPDDLQAATQRINDAVKNKTPLDNEYRIRYPDGRVIWINALGRTTYDAAGQPVRMTGICFDISARKQAEAKISEQLDELKRWHNATLGREDRVMELKREVNRLLVEAGKPPRYASVLPGN